MTENDNLQFTAYGGAKATSLMNTFRTFAELNGKLLEYDDHVIFEHEEFHIEYRVAINTLWEINNNNNQIENKIFQLLGLDPFDFCKQHYNELYDDWEIENRKFPDHWPPHYSYDYVSITKVVLELFRLIEEQKQLAETSETLFID